MKPDQWILLLILFPTPSVSRKHKTTIQPGKWSDWGKWDEHCSVTCGIGVRRRVRKCSYKGKQRKYECKGNKGQLKNCDTQLTCPVHGSWSSWVAWDCSVSCGGGTGQKKRTCTNPMPLFGGKKCEGKSDEDGACNEQKCADQVFTLSPGTAQKMKDATEKVHFSFKKNEKSNIDLACAANVVGDIFKEYPRSVLFWTKNGEVLAIDRERMQLGLTELSILELTPQDSGVYLCSIRYAPEVVKPMAVISVAVIPKKPTFEVHEEESVTLTCHGSQLEKIYKDLSQEWFHGKKVYKEFKNSTLIESNVYEIKNVTSNMTGLWECKIKDSKRKWTWTTNVVRLKVNPPLPLILKYLRDRNFMIIAGTTVFAAIFTVGAYIGYKITKARENYMTDFRIWRTISAYEYQKI